MASIPACHAGDQGSIPCDGNQHFWSSFSCICCLPCFYHLLLVCLVIVVPKNNFESAFDVSFLALESISLLVIIFLHLLCMLLPSATGLIIVVPNVESVFDISILALESSSSDS